ncbi:MAG TPA: YggT family protein [Gemmatimonadales bacterium]|jgi:YggT family protein
MALSALDYLARALVILALSYASIVALTYWAVRTRRINPFGAWPRFTRRISEPILLPLERRIIGAGGSPQDASLWLVGLVIVGGLLLLSLVHWLIGMAGTMVALTYAGPRAWLRFVLGGVFTILMAAIFIRVVASWLGLSPYRRWMRPVMVLTDWLIEPIRRILPPFGMLDFSPMVAWLVLWVVRGFVMGMI